MNNLRFAFRQLLKNPGFTAVAVLTLALGIGANTTIFSMINGILIKPLKVRQPGQLVGVYQHDRDNPDTFNLFSYPDFADLRTNSKAVFTDLFAFGIGSVGWQGELTEKISVDLVSANYFSALGVAPALGRELAPAEGTSGAPVAVLSHSFWMRLGGDPAIIGRQLRLTRGKVTVIGVMPRGFTGAQLLAPAMFLPLGMAGALTGGPGRSASAILSDRGDRWLMLMGRLKPGLTLANVGGPLAAVSRELSIPDPAQPTARTLICRPPARFGFSNAPDRAAQELGPAAGFALGLSLLVLCIACLNLANLMLARGAARRKEIAVRLALGAGRGRVLSQLLTEGLLLALLGGAAGLLVSQWATELAAAFVYSGMPSDSPRFDLAPDWRVCVSLLLLSGLATLFFALGPAWMLARLEVNSDLKRQAGEGAHEHREGRFGVREVFAAVQMAFALALLVAAALFSRSAMNAVRANPGFEFGSKFCLSLDFGLTGYPQPRQRQLVRAATARLSTLPGVASVSAAMNIPFGDSDQARGVQRGGAPPAAGAATIGEGKLLGATYDAIGADYFRTLGIPLRRGREFDRWETDTTNGPAVAIISRNLADQLWPGQEALGRLIQFPGDSPNLPPTVMTVVGIVPEVHWKLFERDGGGEVYVPLGRDFHANLKLLVRVAPGVDLKNVMSATRDALRRLDPKMPLTGVETLAAVHQESMTMRLVGLGSWLFGAFGLLATLLSLLGVYGVRACSVARRTREIGIRMALGADAQEVVAMILRESAWLGLLGLGLGLLLALVVGKLAEGFLYRVPAMDPLTFSVIPTVLFAMALLACLAPARRAAKVDPMEALRYE